MSNPYDIFIIGSGVAGMAAAGQAAQRGLRVALAEGGMFGGLVLNINRLWPGPEGMPESGVDLSAELMMRATELGVENIPEHVTAIEPGEGGGWTVVTGAARHAARSVIVASGASHRALGIPGEAEFQHRGVSHCADCDGPMVRGKPGMVVGGGDSALQEALILAEYCPVVHLVHRGDRFTARPDFVEAVGAAAPISVRFGTVVEALEGVGGLSHARLRDLRSGAHDRVEVQGFFAMVGLVPNTGFLPPGAVQGQEPLAVDDHLETSLPGMYAIGAVRAGFGGEVGHALEDANRAVAAISARLQAA